MKAIFSKADIILFVLLLLVAAAGIILMSGDGQAQTAVIRQNGVVVKEVPLDVNQTFSVGDVTFEIKDGEIAFIESDCPNKECIHAGWLHIPGATAACLPNRISITLSGESEVDAIAN